MRSSSPASRTPPWGVVTALDIAAAAATGPTESVARDIAATEPVTVSVFMSLSEAARVMVEHQVNHVLVADSGGQPVGVVSTTDARAASPRPGSACATPHAPPRRTPAAGSSRAPSCPLRMV